MAESILHYGAATFRVQGTGNLKLTFFGINKVKSFVFTNPISMVTAARTEPTKLANFKSQRALLRFETTDLDEYVDINRIIIWIKPIGTQYPSQLNA